MLDEDCPTDWQLNVIQAWPHDDLNGLMEYVRKIWKYADFGYWAETNGVYLLSTAGWSGNEEIVRALQCNRWFWMRCWVCSRRGGHFEFKIPAQAAGEEARQAI